jgi:hypothetical protein
LLDDLFGFAEFFDDIDSERSDIFESMREELARDRRQMQQQWRLQNDRELLSLGTSDRPRPQYTYDPQIRKVRLAYERVNWQKEGF